MQRFIKHRGFSIFLLLVAMSVQVGTAMHLFASDHQHQVNDEFDFSHEANCEICAFIDSINSTPVLTGTTEIFQAIDFVVDQVNSETRVKNCLESYLLNQRNKAPPTV